MIKKQLQNGVSYSYIQTSQFKTTLISVGFYVPLGSDNSANSLCLSLIRSGTKALPDLYSLNRKLASLYGAGITSWTTKNGDAMELRLNLTVNDDRFCLEGDGNVTEAGKLLNDMIFSRITAGERYPAEVFQREKRLLCEKISGALNEKRTYARSRCEALMCEGEPFGLAVDGTLEEAQALTEEKVYDAFKALIETAFVSIIVIGATEPTEFCDDFVKNLNVLGRQFKALPENTVKKGADTCREYDEKLPVKQGKLVLGLRSEHAGSDRETVAIQVMADIFGGGPHGKLFCNVREKMSLCYYCAARAVRSKGLIFVDSGVEEKNITAAREAIMQQFEDMKNGSFTEDELRFSKLSLIDSIRSVESDQPTLARWYAARSLDEGGMSPAEACEAIEAITADDVKQAAGGFVLDTVYRLLPDGSVQEAEE